MKKIILVGAGGHCKSCIDVIENKKKFKIVAIIDKKKTKKKLLKYKVFDEKYLNKISPEGYSVIITVGQIKNFKVRERLFNKVKKLGFHLPYIKSPSAYVSKHSKIGEGTIIMHDAIINAGTSIGKNCIINTNSLIEHDVVIGDHTHVSTRATVNGNVLVEKKVFVGSRSVIKNNIKIGQGSIIGANLYIKKNLPENSYIKK